MTTEMKFVTQIKNSLRRKTIVRASMLAVLTAAGAMASNPTDAPGIGIERIRKMHEYNNTTRINIAGQGIHHSYFGYAIKPGRHRANEIGVTIENAMPQRMHVPTTFLENQGIVISTFDKDIKDALLDKELFNTHIAEDSLKVAVDK